MQITSKLREQYLETKKGVVFSLFEAGLVGPRDFEIKDKYVIFRVARLLVKKMMNLGLELSDLFFHESILLKQVANLGIDFLNRRGTLEQGIAVLKWFEALWKMYAGSSSAPPGGPEVISEHKLKGGAQYTYRRITVRHISFPCFGKPKVTDMPFMFRSDLNAYDLREMLYQSQPLMFGHHYQYYTFVSGLYYNGIELKMSQKIPDLRDNAIIKVKIGSCNMNNRIQHSPD